MMIFYAVSIDMCDTEFSQNDILDAHIQKNIG